VYKKYNSLTNYVSISNADRNENLSYIATVYNGINTKDFQYRESPEDYLLYFGRIHPDKGTAEAIAIARRSKRKLLLAGIIQDENYFKTQVEPYLNDNILFLGQAGPEQRNELLGNAIALLHPINFEEPFGLSVAEAMLCGTPVIAFNKGSMPELIQHEKTGFLVNSIEEAIESVEQLSYISRSACREWSLAQFSMEKMTGDYLEVYKNVLSR
jgi:glycosyltransferase involved in cell wall biosynthesis